MKNISFTQEVKEEICGLPFQDDELKSLLSGFVKIKGNLVLNQQETLLILKTENAKIAKLIFKAFQTLYNISPSFSYEKKMKLNKSVIFNVIISQNVFDILEDLELFEQYMTCYPKTLILGEKLRFFITGCFLASGTLNSPSSDDYHLQFAVSDYEDAKFLLKILNRFKNERTMNFKIIARKTKYIIYLKRADQIAVFLALTGASQSMLAFENTRIERDFINSENRYQICFNANYQKTMNKSKIQLEAIQIIEDKLGINNLDEKSRSVAILRKENPEASLSAISELLKDEYQIVVSKSGVNRIFTYLQNLADKLKGDTK